MAYSKIIMHQGCFCRLSDNCYHDMTLGLRLTSEISGPFFWCMGGLLLDVGECIIIPVAFSGVPVYHKVP